MSNLAYKQPQQGQVVQFPKKERQAMSDSLSKGFIMKSRLYHYEVEPFLTDAAKNVYSAIMGYTNGFNKPSDHISHRQLQGGKLKGSSKLSSATVSSGLKELIWFGVISVVEKNNKIGNKYQINEVSLVEYFEKFSALEIKALRISNESALISEALQLVKQSALVSKAQGALVSSASIEFLFIDSFRNILNNSLRSNRPLENHFFVFQGEKKQAVLEQQKIEAEEKAKAEKERKDKTRKLSYDEVINLTKTVFVNLCDFSLWEQYVSQRSTTSKTKLTKNALNAIYEDFKAWGVDGSNQSLKASIAGSYQGLFAPKNHVPVQKTQSSTRWSEIQELIEKEEQGNDSYGF
ncbi:MULTISPECIES: hypothetical protein [unclassified Acinetobacter]|uniref:hypothetical protein n=1 Tax=unclassified Acinetobacter TaxID=196816 RepID=UPI00244A8234|nr:MULTISPECIES: hypothetical protein [unclassified Acinetobacter]MDH0032037.1 replication protein [Acinetobacter sp. GD04021]MDH0887693.1 replication protein [Acinetobacter sp. GD03873]MDH1084041.1 replication protein [Acinetobacter sp. GD03983]MDH2191032.1 replication protein [Acinetobacter sp. GD03645]MDH2204553.1 replication protein [Acinetobacter sp. GD03647]